MRMWTLGLWGCLIVVLQAPTLASAGGTHTASRERILDRNSNNQRRGKPLHKNSGRSSSSPSGGRHSHRGGSTGSTALSENPSSAEERLLINLFRDYDTDARGVAMANETVTVVIEFLLLRIQGLDERSQVLTTTGLVITDWVDDRLKWDPADYNDLTDVVVKPDRIWLPELALMNGADELAPDFKKIRVLLMHNGSVHWEPGGIFMTTCDIDIRYFPFDEQECLIQVGAWAYSSSRMNLTNSSNTVMTHEFRLNGEWEVYASIASWSETILPCCPDKHYPYVQFTLYLRRRYTFYIMNIILPCTLLSILVMVVFCLPPDAGEKISLGISVLLAFTVFLLMVAENIPRTSLHVPIMVVYLTCTMALGTVSVCLTVVVLNLHHRDAERPVPKWAKVLVLSYLSKFLCVRARKPKTLAHEMALYEPGANTNLRGGIRKLAKDVQILKPMLNKATTNSLDNDGYSQRNNANQNDVFPAFYDDVPNVTHDWRELAHVMDRLFFWLVFIFMTASTMIILLVPFYRDPKQKNT